MTWRIHLPECNCTGSLSNGAECRQSACGASIPSRPYEKVSFVCAGNNVEECNKSPSHMQEGWKCEEKLFLRAKISIIIATIVVYNRMMQQLCTQKKWVWVDNSRTSGFVQVLTLRIICIECTNAGELTLLLLKILVMFTIKYGLSKKYSSFQQECKMCFPVTNDKCDECQHLRFLGLANLPWSHLLTQRVSRLRPPQLVASPPTAVGCVDVARVSRWSWTFS